MTRATKAAEDGVLFLPDSFLRMRNIDPRQVAPSWLKSRHVILEGYEHTGDIGQIAGRAHKPGEMTVVGRGEGRMPLVIIHDRQTEAAEIEDLVLEAKERKPFDFAASRQRMGLPSREEFDPLLRQAAEDYVKRAKANPSVVRPRQPMQPFVKGLVQNPAMTWKGDTE